MIIALYPNIVKEKDKQRDFMENLRKTREVDISAEIKNLVPVLGKDSAAKLERAYLLGEENTRKRIIEMVDILKAAVFADKDLKDAVLIEPISKEKALIGDLFVGTVLYGKKKLYPIMLDKELLLTHMGVFGSSGYGKTNIIHWMSQQLSAKNIPVIIFDFSKRNYRDLLSIPELKDKIVVYTVGREVAPFRFNPLKPPEGVEISQWAKEFSEIFDHAYWLLGGGRHVILKALDLLYEKNNIPKIADLRMWLRDYAPQFTSSREKNWLSTAERPLESLCFMDTGKIFDCEEGITPATFFKKGQITILELDALSTNDKTFFIEILLQWMRDWLVVNNFREKLAAAVVLEEAHHVLNRDKAKRLGIETIIDLIFREIRELGIGMIYVDQHPSLVSYPALGNTSTHIYMNLGLDTQHSSDIKDAAAMLNLSEEETPYLRKLPVGHAFMLCRRLDFNSPFLVEFPLVNLKKGSVTDEMVGKAMRSAKREVEEEKPAGKEDEAKKETRETPEEIDGSHLKIIRVLGEGLGSQTSEIYNIIGISGSAFQRKIETLIKAGLVESREAKVYKQFATYYYLTESGEALFKERFGPGKENEIAISNITGTLARMGWGYDPSKEAFVSRGDGKKLLYLVTSTRKNKVFKDIPNNELYLLCASEQIKNIVVQEAAKHGKMKINIATLSEMENNKWKTIEFA